ncbi:MAG: alpha-glucan family phosphorylase [Candidatus Bathyarchaeota archaeon]|nr:MAG: alpha-glucan family phosphorylase [Candidatus Bathyarchaeota archaeon]
MQRVLAVYEEPRIAYFTMEVGLRNDIPTYAGGLGVLAGDVIRSSADLSLPLVAVTLISKKGHFKQQITKEGKQIEQPMEWVPSSFLRLLREEVEVELQKRQVKVKAWLYECCSKSLTGGTVPVIFLDTDVKGNVPEDREITHFLYGGDERYRLKQEVVLGIGGARMLEALGFEIRRYHMNEGHSSLLTLELLQRNGMDVDKVRNMCIFTTHTPMEAGHDKFPYDLVQEVIGEPIPLHILKRFGGKDRLNMTRLALNLSEYVNGVSKRHRSLTKEMFPGFEVQAITNGIYSFNWTCEHFRNLLDRYIPGWANEPELLVRVDGIPNEEIWRAHTSAKMELIDYVNSVTGVGMDYETLTLGFARRATAYKRAYLIFSDFKRLRRINQKAKIQLIFAGKAHPKDNLGKELIKTIFDYIEELKSDIKIIYLEDYDLEIAAKLVSGVDVWLNTPLPPLEASGTSGMKAAHNGVINFSVLDGWWIEGWIEDVTGWSIGPDPDEQLTPKERTSREIEDLYGKLEYIIAPRFYRERREWIDMMKNSIGKIAYYFNSHRMMRKYATAAYI